MQQLLNVAIIGAGFSGVGAAIRLLEQGITNFRVFDKASEASLALSKELLVPRTTLLFLVPKLRIESRRQSKKP
jgi:2-polyprenyl-6-methoxyphenol hydroxylase-like FAD-dependent oxidoreductase